MIMNIVRKDSPAAASEGNNSEAVSTVLPDNTPPIAGPAMKPILTAPPTIPIPWARFSGGVISVMYAVATAKFPAISPVRKRPASKSQILSAKSAQAINK